MKVNFLSDYIKFKNFGVGINGAWVAAKNQAEAMRKYVNVSINRSRMDCDLIHSHGNFLYTYRIMRKACKSDIPIIITAHQTNRDTDISFIFSGSINEIVKQYIIRYLQLADLIICPTENSKKLVKKELEVTQPIKVISNGVDTQNFKKSQKKRNAFRERFGINKPTILSVGMPTSRKGFMDFIEISKKTKKYIYLWVGKRIFPIIQPNNIINKGNLVMPGYINDICQAYSAADIFCFPSYYEGEGLAVLEAMSCGLPVIIRDLPVYENRFYDGKNCLKAKNNKQFIDNIKYLLENPQEKKKIIENGLKTVKQFDINKIALKLYKIYRCIVN
jgi:1,2-diacylglycerol-3-alpha-glucose alpha-1,2-glucosyltransferase